MARNISLMPIAKHVILSAAKNLPSSRLDVKRKAFTKPYARRPWFSRRRLSLTVWAQTCRLSGIDTYKPRGDGSMPQ